MNRATPLKTALRYSLSASMLPVISLSFGCQANREVIVIDAPDDHGRDTRPAGGSVPGQGDSLNESPKDRKITRTDESITTRSEPTMVPK